MIRSKEKAVALKYNSEEDIAPIVVASGYGSVAEKIVNIAEKTGIPVYKDETTASLLCMLEVGQSIPEDLYQVVAMVYKSIIDISAEIKGKSNLQDDIERYRKDRNRRLKLTER
ncbi:MAG: EscU/YscU/HrcU family type III secretion system export apparatus switch protein [Oscillospiraceae bacterium]